jgi:hypothetical protein
MASRGETDRTSVHSYLGIEESDGGLIACCGCGWCSRPWTGESGAPRAINDYHDHVVAQLGASAFYSAGVACSNCGSEHDQSLLVGIKVEHATCRECGTQGSLIPSNTLSDPAAVSLHRQGWTVVSCVDETVAGHGDEGLETAVALLADVAELPAPAREISSWLTHAIPSDHCGDAIDLLTEAANKIRTGGFTPGPISEPILAAVIHEGALAGNGGARARYANLLANACTRNTADVRAEHPVILRALGPEVAASLDRLSDDLIAGRHCRPSSTSRSAIEHDDRAPSRHDGETLATLEQQLLIRTSARRPSPAEMYIELTALGSSLVNAWREPRAHGGGVDVHGTSHQEE